MGFNSLSSRYIKEDGSVVNLAETYDTLVNGLTFITIEHSQIHRGEGYSALYKATIAVATSAYIQIKTGAKTVHLKLMDFSTDGDKFAVEFYENPTLTDGATAIPIINRDRTSGNTPQTVMYSGPTGVSGGTKIDEFYIGGSVGASTKTVGGDIFGGIYEFILKPNTNYLYKITNQGAGDATIMTRMFFYEV